MAVPMKRHTSAVRVNASTSEGVDIVAWTILAAVKAHSIAVNHVLGSVSLAILVVLR